MTETTEWAQLSELRRRWRDRRVDECFARDPSRVERLSCEAAGLYVDFSRQRLDEDVISGLVDLANRRDLPGAIEALWRGDNVNHTESRPALHMALRGMPGDGIADAAVEERVATERERMRRIVDEVRNGEWAAPDGSSFKHIVHVGIGGSHLGPALVLDALDWDPGNGNSPNVCFVSATDPTAYQRMCRGLDPSKTLLVVASKSFGTRETLLNANMLVDWLATSSDRRTVLAEQVIGVSGNTRAMDEFGIPAAHQLDIPEWVGGRYSVWSSVGVTIALRLGWETFADFLDGARSMDRHFRSAEPRQNLGWLMALVGIWNTNFFDTPMHAVLPYAECLQLLPNYLQQLEMESNGKRIDRDGQPVNYRTAPVLWGGVGQNGQHAFFQQLHQGTGWVPLDLVLVGGGEISDSPQRRVLLANALAQAEALTHGRSEREAREELGDSLEHLAYKQFPGNRPSTIICLDELDAFRLGSLLALYEHKVYVQSVIWNLNPFDQFGVELGKEIASDIEQGFRKGELGEGHDASTQALFARLMRKR
ncbi:MAG: glucose-6-phosphate isomerase [Gammaproteobacteria bacterium]|nr:glucose-6-phosphate isomerase [Gammaproteobacteria bacterium]